MKFIGRRVLVVEDEFLVSLETIDCLESVGCIVLGPAIRVDAAIDLVRSESMDAAVLDIELSGEMIWPVVEELLRRRVPAVFLSAYAQLDMIPRVFASIPRLDKPLEKHRLIERLDWLWRPSLRS